MMYNQIERNYWMGRISQYWRDIMNGKRFKFKDSYSNINDQNSRTIDLYIHKKELECLKELIGDPGIEFLKNNWIKQEFLIQMQHFLSMNLETLGRISSEWINDSTLEMIKKLRGNICILKPGIKDLMVSVNQISFSLMILRKLIDTISLEANGKYISLTLEYFADVPLLFACLILLYISDEQNVNGRIMECGLYLMRNQSDQLIHFISVITLI